MINGFMSDEGHAALIRHCLALIPTSKFDCVSWGDGDGGFR